MYFLFPHFELQNFYIHSAVRKENGKHMDNLFPIYFNIVSKRSFLIKESLRQLHPQNSAAGYKAEILSSEL